MKRGLLLLFLVLPTCAMPTIVEKSKRPAIDAATALTLAYLVNPPAAAVGVFLVDLFQEVGEMGEELKDSKEAKNELINDLIEGAVSGATTPFDEAIKRIKSFISFILWSIGALVLLYLIKQVYSSKKAKRVYGEILEKVEEMGENL